MHCWQTCMERDGMLGLLPFHSSLHRVTLHEALWTPNSECGFVLCWQFHCVWKMPLLIISLSCDSGYDCEYSDLDTMNVPYGVNHVMYLWITMFKHTPAFQCHEQSMTHLSLLKGRRRCSAVSPSVQDELPSLILLKGNQQWHSLVLSASPGHNNSVLHT